MDWLKGTTPGNMFFLRVLVGVSVKTSLKQPSDTAETTVTWASQEWKAMPNVYVYLQI